MLRGTRWSPVGVTLALPFLALGCADDGSATITGEVAGISFAGTYGKAEDQPDDSGGRVLVFREHPAECNDLADEGDEILMLFLRFWERDGIYEVPPGTYAVGEQEVRGKGLLVFGVLGANDGNDNFMAESGHHHDQVVIRGSLPGLVRPDVRRRTVVPRGVRRADLSAALSPGRAHPS